MYCPKAALGRLCWINLDSLVAWRTAGRLAASMLWRPCDAHSTSVILSAGLVRQDTTDYWISTPLGHLVGSEENHKKMVMLHVLHISFL